MSSIGPKIWGRDHIKRAGEHKLKIIKRNKAEVDFNVNKIAVAVAKGSPLRDQINAILATISEEKREELMQWAVDNQPLSE